MSDQSFEQMVISRLDDIKEDLNRANDQHNEGLKKLFELHEVHVADDIKRFESIDDQFTAAAVNAAETKGAAKVTARMWGLAMGLPTPIGAGIWAIWKALHKLP